MRITVLGATGAVGREVVAEARTRGHEVREASRATGVDATRVVDVALLSAGTLRTTTGTLVQDAPDFPSAWRPIALACAEQLDACLAEFEVDWTYLSPAALLEPGPRTGRYRSAADDLVTDATGESRISTADLAVALLDEVEHPRRRRARFTVGY